jgi:hypothetical protein
MEKQDKQVNIIQHQTIGHVDLIIAAIPAESTQSLLSAFICKQYRYVCLLYRLSELFINFLLVAQCRLNMIGVNYSMAIK